MPSQRHSPGLRLAGEPHHREPAGVVSEDAGKVEFIVSGVSCIVVLRLLLPVQTIEERNITDPDQLITKFTCEEVSICYYCYYYYISRFFL